ncbi:hypothetical protein OAH87_01020 [Marinomonas sp.]|nr:hypothetical protein [Marinomonas sp.]MDB4837035.1 hypothetical protein [Marinomonas sp.]
MENNVVLSRAKLEWSLLGLRLGVFIVLFMWAIDKVLNPNHTAAVLNAFYGIEGSSATLSYILGAIQLTVVLSFLVGFQKRWVTLIVLVIHASSTFISFGKYLDPWSGVNLLFFAAWPMLAGIAVLYILREFDTKFSISK